MGIQQTSPGFSTFTVRPRLGSMANASIKVPTLRGPVEVEANTTHTLVGVPCNTVAMLCVRHDAGSAEAARAIPLRLLLDGVAVATPKFEHHHLCAGNVGCGVGGAARVLTLAL